MKQKDNLKRKKIDRLDARYHILLLLFPILLIVFSFYLLNPLGENNWLGIALISMIYLIGYSLTYYLHQGRLNRLWLHLEHVLNINDATYELVKLSNQYQDLQSFLSAMLKKAVNTIDGAEMGSIVLLDKETNKLSYVTAIGLDTTKLDQVHFALEESFQYRLTNGHCDRVVVINDINSVDANRGLSRKDQNTLRDATQHPIKSTLSTPIHIEGKLYAMLNLDSSSYGAFSDYDSNLVSILTQEACNAIALYHKNQKIHQLANFDPLTQLCNRQAFETKLGHWPQKPHLGTFLVILDMDNLKEINDNLGHQAGDTAILALANVLKSEFETQNLIGRFGGDEFVLIAYGPLGKLKLQIEQVQQALNHSADIQFSYGIAAYEDNWQQAFKQADADMYLQKRSKKNARSYELTTRHLVS